jgi:hypothetical protein
MWMLIGNLNYERQLVFAQRDAVPLARILQGRKELLIILGTIARAQDPRDSRRSRGVFPSSVQLRAETN